MLAPAVLTLMASDGIASAVLGGTRQGRRRRSPSCRPGLLGAFLVYFVLGFALYAALYAGAGSLLSRAEDLQIVALPLSIPAIAGYLPAVMALSGGTSAFIRFASYVPLWSPFVMMARLATSTVEPWELVLSVGLLAATVPLVTWLAIRVFRAGVLQYGQPPTVRTFLRAVRDGRAGGPAVSPRREPVGPRVAQACEDRPSQAYPPGKPRSIALDRVQVPKQQLHVAVPGSRARLAQVPLDEVPVGARAAHERRVGLAREHVPPPQHLGDLVEVGPRRDRDRAEVGDRLHDQFETIVHGLAAAVVDEAEAGR